MADMPRSSGGTGLYFCVAHVRFRGGARMGAFHQGLALTVRPLVVPLLLMPRSESLGSWVAARDPIRPRRSSVGKNSTAQFLRAICRHRKTSLDHCNRTYHLSHAVTLTVNIGGHQHHRDRNAQDFGVKSQDRTGRVVHKSEFSVGRECLAPVGSSASHNDDPAALTASVQKEDSGMINAEAMNSVTEKKREGGLLF